MKKQQRTAWFCSACGAESPKWQGKCPACGQWNTMVEEKVSSRSSKTFSPGGVTRKSVPVAVADIEGGAEERFTMPSNELNRVLGGGLVKGSMVLIGGEPGIGKSTLVLQNTLSIRPLKVLYVSGEESVRQIKMRADRIGRSETDNVFVVCETSLETIMEHVDSVKPQLIVIDSIQTIASDELDSPSGSVSQVRECAARLLYYAKTTGTPVLIIGHITKEGSIAGPKVLEHIVDTVLQFEGDSRYMYRILRAIKNRFGSTAEIGIYEMCQRGLREVSDPSMMMMSHAGMSNDLSGLALGVTIEGIRPFIIETQALVSTAAYGTPQRSVTGFDSKRLNMLLAVLEKRAGFKLAQKDVFFNITGGIRVNDPALDLAVIAAILSANIDVPLPRKLCLVGEVGLSGEIRPVVHIDRRVREAAKMGIEKIVVPAGNLKGFENPNPKTLKIVEVDRVEAACRELFG